MTNAERQAAWRERRRALGLTINPRRQQPGYRPPSSRLPWMFIDTEGASDPEGIYGDPGRQYCMAIAAADDAGAQSVLHTGSPIGTREALYWICGLPSSGRCKLGGYFFGYDIDQLLWQVPADKLRRLHGSGGVPQGPCQWGRYLLAVFNGQLTVAVPHGGYHGELCPDTGEPASLVAVKGIRRVIWDVGRFYQSRFSTAIEDWQVATDEEQELIERMKRERSDFTLDYWNGREREIIEYSLLENRLAARMQNRFDETMSELGYPLRQWYGAGSVAKSMLEVRGVRRHLEQRAPMPARKAAGRSFADSVAAAYFGGRFEIREPGEIAAPIFEYDLRSAYPASCQNLPCLVHGRWAPARDDSPPGPHDLCVVSWRVSREDLWGPFPVRDRASRICYPSTGARHSVWGEELQAALAMWGDRIRIERRWEYRTRCDCRPFDWIGEVYEQRRALGKDRKGWALKLGMNAAYGTLASALGATFHAGRVQSATGGAAWCEPRWAGLITAWTRARMLDALRAAGGPKAAGPIMFATDAIYSTQPIELNLADALGGWEEHRYSRGGLLIQPGVYHLRGQRAANKLRGRGIASRDIQQAIRRFYAAWRRDGWQAKVTLTLQPRYQGVRLMLHRGTPERAQRWEIVQRELAFDPRLKRRLAKDGRWMPRTRGVSPLETASYPHPRFAALFAGTEYQPSPEDLDLIESQLLEEDQPESGYAL